MARIASANQYFRHGRSGHTDNGVGNVQACCKISDALYKLCNWFVLSILRNFWTRVHHDHEIGGVENNHCVVPSSPCRIWRNSSRGSGTSLQPLSGIARSFSIVSEKLSPDRGFGSKDWILNRSRFHFSSSLRVQ